MGNLYWLNSFFEFEIAAYPSFFTPSSKLLTKYLSIEYLFLAMSHSTDFICFSQKPDAEILQNWKMLLGDMGVPIIKDEWLSKGYNFVEWGDMHTFKSGKFLSDTNKIEKSKYLNSKINQISWKDPLQKERFATKVGYSSTDLKAFSEENGFPFVIKQDLSFSGIGNHIIRKESDLSNLKLNESFVMEKWKENRILDFSGIFEINNGDISLLAVTRMSIGKNGTYNSSMISNDSDSEIGNLLLKTAKELFESHKIIYNGPFSIDGFKYLEDGEIHVQNLSEVNFRYSMGRVLHEIRSRRKKNASSALIFPTYKIGMDAAIIYDRLNFFSKLNKIELFFLSPLCINEKPVLSPAIYLEGEESVSLFTFIEALPQIIS